MLCRWKAVGAGAGTLENKSYPCRGEMIWVGGWVGGRGGPGVSEFFFNYESKFIFFSVGREGGRKGA